MIINTENIKDLLKSNYPSTHIGTETGLNISGINKYRTGKSKVENITLKYMEGLQKFYDDHRDETIQHKIDISGIRKSVGIYNNWQGAARIYFDPSDNSVWTKIYNSPNEWDQYHDKDIIEIASKATQRMDERDNQITMRKIRELVGGVIGNGKRCTRNSQHY